MIFPTVFILFCSIYWAYYTYTEDSIGWILGKKLTEWLFFIRFSCPFSHCRLFPCSIIILSFPTVPLVHPKPRHHIYSPPPTPFTHPTQELWTICDREPTGNHRYFTCAPRQCIFFVVDKINDIFRDKLNKFCYTENTTELLHQM